MNTDETRSYEQLQTTIASQYSQLSQKLQQAASYVRDHPESVALSTVAELAQKACVSPAALIRLAAALGFTGFSEMQQVFRQHFLQGSNYRTRAQLVCHQQAQTSIGILDHFVDASVEAIQQLHGVPRQRIEEAVDQLVAASNTFVIGLRRAFPVASYLAYSFWQSQHPVQLLDGVGGMLPSQIESIKKDDVLLAISYSPHADETQQVIHQAQKQQAQVILLTDERLSHCKPEADLTIEVPEAEVGGFRSLTSSMCLAQAIVVSLAYRLGNTSLLKEQTIKEL